MKDQYSRIFVTDISAKNSLISDDQAAPSLEDELGQITEEHNIIHLSQVISGALLITTVVYADK